MEPWKESELSQEMWDTVLLWSGYDGYYTIPEIAMKLRTKKKTIESRIERFAKGNPEAYKKIQDDRAAIKATTLRLDRALDHPWKYEMYLEEQIKDKF